MPTFTNPAADAEEASQALRGLAHASRLFEQPARMYGVLGDLLGGLRSLEQVLGQLADNHTNQRGRAADDAGSRTAGTRDALSAAAELRDAAVFIAKAERRLDAASAAAGRIAWQPTTQTPSNDGRLINIVFLQGGEADGFLTRIDQGGADGVVQSLAGYDFGDETVSAALENGYVYDEPPMGALDRSYKLDAYTLVYNHDHRHIALYRHEDALPSPVLLGIDEPRHAAPTTEANEAAEGWLARRQQLGNPDLEGSDPELDQSRGLSL